MTWAPMLLADPSPCLRYLVLRDLLCRTEDDPELLELVDLRRGDPLVAQLAEAQQADGSWEWWDSSSVGGPIKRTAVALARLGYLGLGLEEPMVQHGAEYLYSQQREDGAWSLGVMAEGEREGYSMIPLQTAIPLWGLAMCGYATDPRSERAYEWLLEQRLPDGAWPTGIASDVFGYVAGYRRLAHSRWGCRSNTTGAVSCLAMHPTRRHGEEARRALDLLLGRETREANALGYELARLLGAEPTRGFMTFYARFDLAKVLGLCWRVGISAEDPRVASLIDFLRGIQGEYGLWTYPPRPQVSRWVTFELLRALARLDQGGGWIGLEPRTPFQPYPAQRRRY